jgi:hypothetical protein
MFKTTLKALIASGAMVSADEGWRAERRRLIVSAILSDRGGRLPARHMRLLSACYLRRLVGTGPRFPLPAMAGRSVSS